MPIAKPVRKPEYEHIGKVPFSLRYNKTALLRYRAILARQYQGFAATISAPRYPISLHPRNSILLRNTSECQCRKIERQSQLITAVSRCGIGRGGILSFALHFCRGYLSTQRRYNTNATLTGRVARDTLFIGRGSTTSGKETGAQTLQTHSDNKTPIVYKPYEPRSEVLCEPS